MDGHTNNLCHAAHEFTAIRLSEENDFEEVFSINLFMCMLLEVGFVLIDFIIINKDRTPNYRA